MTFHETVRARRRELGYTSADVAGVMDVSPSYVRRMEMGPRGGIVPGSKDRIVALALALEEDPEDLWDLAMVARLAQAEPDIYQTLTERGVFDEGA